MIRTVFTLLILVWCTVLRAERPTLADLDAVVTKAPDLATFLATPTLVDEYYEALSRFYGEARLTRAAYDNIVGQLRVVSEKVPGFRERLWETTALGTPFTIETRLGPDSAGRAVNIRAWRNYFAQLRARAATAASPITALPDGHAREARLREIMERVRDARRAVDAQAQSLSAAKARQVRGEGYRRIAQDPDVVAAEAYLAHLFYQSEAAADHERLTDAGAIIGFFRDARGEPRHLYGRLPDELRELAAEALGGARNYIPAVDAMLKAEQLNVPVFPSQHQELRANAPVRYDFAPIPRRVHGIFWGAAMGACVGGGTSENVSQEFWAAIAVKGSQQHVVLRNGEFHGVIAATPGEYQGQTYASVALAAPDLGKWMFRGDTRSTLYGLWLREAAKRKPEEWKAYVLGGSDAFDNWKVHSTARNLSHYQMGEVLGPAASFALTDPIVPPVIGALPRKGLGRIYGGRMILDATVPDAGDLTALTTEFADDLAGSSRELRAILNGGEVARQRRVLEMMLYDRALAERFGPELARLAHSADVGLAARAVLASGVSDPAQALAARLTLLDDPPRGKHASERMFKDLKAATERRPETIPLLEKYFGIKNKRGRIILAELYVQAGGRHPDAEPLVFEYAMEMKESTVSAARQFLAGPGTPSAALDALVQNHVRELAASPDGTLSTTVTDTLARVAKLTPETLAALGTLCDRVTAVRAHILPRTGFIKSFLGRAGDPAARHVVMAAMTRNWFVELSGTINRNDAGFRDRFLVALTDTIVHGTPAQRSGVRQAFETSIYDMRDQARALIPDALWNDLRHAVEKETDPPVAAALARGIGTFAAPDDATAGEVLLRVARRRDPLTYEAAITALDRNRPAGEAMRTLLREDLWHADTRIRQAAFRELGTSLLFDVDDAALLVRRTLDESDRDVVCRAADAIYKRVASSGADPAIESVLVHGIVGLLRRSDSAGGIAAEKAVAAVRLLRARYPSIEETLRRARSTAGARFVAESADALIEELAQKGKPIALTPLPSVRNPNPPRGLWQRLRCRFNF